MDQEQIQKIFAILQPVWPATGLDKAAIPAWTIALDGLDSGLLQAAAAEWVRASKWFPKPFELITLAKDIEAEQVKSGQRALPAPARQYIDPEQIRRVAAKCSEAGILNPYVEQMLAELDAERGAA